MFIKGKLVKDVTFQTYFRVLVTYNCKDDNDIK